MLDILVQIGKIARNAGVIVKKHFDHLSSSEIHKKGTSDLVTDADRETEDYIRSQLAALYPEVGFYGEESSEKKQNPEKGAWFVVDPIDGTTSFVHGHPFHCVSIAYQVDGAVIAGAVHLPFFNQMYWAEKNGGAWKDGRKIHVSQTGQLIDALGGTGFGCVRSGIKPDNVPVLAELIYKLRGFRTCGSAAIDLCYVAEGRYDTYWEFYLKPWDWAAGRLIVEEAGGKVTGFDDCPPKSGIGRILASNGILHGQILDIIQKHI